MLLVLIRKSVNNVIDDIIRIRSNTKLVLKNKEIKVNDPIND